MKIRPETSFAAATTRDSKFATRRGESFVRHRDGRRARRNLRERHRRGKGHSLLRTSAFPLAFALSFAFVAVPRDDVRDERVDDGVDDDGVESNVARESDVACAAKFSTKPRKPRVAPARAASIRADANVERGSARA